MAAMQLKYDRQVDALAIDFRPAGRAARTVRVTDTVRVDLDAQGRLLSLEVLDASWNVPREALAHLAPAGHELTLAQAAQESGLQASTLRVLLNRGRLLGRKLGQNWLVDATALTNYLESREARGRPAVNPKGRRRAG